MSTEPRHQPAPDRAGGPGGGPASAAGVRGILEGLDPQQRAAVTAPRGPVCILAGAGTGKTRTITHRIAHLVTRGHVRGDQVLAVTFTARAAGELRSRLARLGVAHAGTGPVQARTFHAAALRNLGYFWPRVYGDQPWQLLDNSFRAVAQAVRRAGVDPTTETIRDVLAEIGWAKASLLTPETYPERAAALSRSVPIPVQRVASAFGHYEELKRSAPVRLLDFDDLLSFMATAIEEDETVAEEFRDRYRCFVVDEFQDVTPAQDRLLRAWVGRRDDLTVVGDANQTIYSFAGAEPDFLLRFGARFPGTEVVRLESDYRSTPQVVEVANAVIAGGSDRFRAAGLRLRGMRPDGPEPELVEYADEEAEAAGVASRIADLVHSGSVDAGEIAVLFRVNAQSERMEAALDEVGIGYRVRGGEGFFDRAEIRRALSALDRLVERVAAEPDPAPQGGEEVLEVVRAALEPVGLTAAEPAGTSAREAWQSLTSLMGIVEEIVATEPEPEPARVVAQVRARAAARHAPDATGVSLSTVHAAKGLEWDAVFLVGVHEGGLPLSHAVKAGDEAIEEERRLLYVGVTRARERLTISWSRSRSPGGRASRRPSRFLDPLRPDPGPAARAAGGGGPRSRSAGVCSRCGQRLTGPTHRALGTCPDCSEDVDLELFEALRGWRSEVATSTSTPHFMVLTNEVLANVARQRPTTLAALGRISGIGPGKLQDYGPDLIRVVGAHA